jgi:hypothetical protein
VTVLITTATKAGVSITVSRIEVTEDVIVVLMTAPEVTMIVLIIAVGNTTRADVAAMIEEIVTTVTIVAASIDLDATAQITAVKGGMIDSAIVREALFVAVLPNHVDAALRQPARREMIETDITVVRVRVPHIGYPKEGVQRLIRLSTRTRVR